MAGNARDTLVTAFKSLLGSGMYSDLVITCRGDTYKVHKSVVCTRSGFFKRAEGFSVGKESAEGKINLPEDEASIVKLLVQYLYQAEYNPKLPDSGCMDENHEIVFTGRRRNNNHYKFPHSCQGSRCSASQVCEHHCCGNYCDYDCVDFICQSCCPNTLPVVTFPPAKGDAKQLLLHAKMYEIADKYDVVGLKQLAREKFLRATAQYWNSELFAPAAHYAFSTTPEQDEGLRDVVSKTISTHMVLLNKPAVEALLTEFNGLAFGLLKMRAKELGWLKSD